MVPRRCTQKSQGNPLGIGALAESPGALGTSVWPQGVPAQHRDPVTATMEPSASGRRDPQAAWCLWHPWDRSSQLRHCVTASQNAFSPFCTPPSPSCAAPRWSPAFSHPCAPSLRLSVELSAASMCQRTPQACFSPSSGDGHSSFLGRRRQ